MTYHINPKTGESSLCKAEQGNCPFGSEHYNTSNEAYIAQDEINQELTELSYNNKEVSQECYNKYSLIRAELLKMGKTQYTTEMRKDFPIVQRAAIDSGYDLEYYYSQKETKKYVMSYLKRTAQATSIAKLIKESKNNNEMYDVYRNELCRRSDKEPISVTFDSLTKSVNNPSDGGTINVNKMISPRKGFCVSPYPEYSEAISGDISQSELKEYLDNYQKKHKEVLERENHYLGYWRSPYDGNLYLDVSIVTEDAMKARELSKKYDQQAFFDLQTFNTVEVDRTALSGQ